MSQDAATVRDSLLDHNEEYRRLNQQHHFVREGRQSALVLVVLLVQALVLLVVIEQRIPHGSGILRHRHLPLERRRLKRQIAVAVTRVTSPDHRARQER